MFKTHTPVPTNTPVLNTSTPPATSTRAAVNTVLASQMGPAKARRGTVALPTRQGESVDSGHYLFALPAFAIVGLGLISCCDVPQVPALATALE